MRKELSRLFLIGALSSSSVAGEQLRSCPVVGEIYTGIPELLENEDYEEVIRRFTPSAESGDPPSQQFLGHIYWFVDKKKAVEWSKLSVEGGCIEGTYLVANAYRKGLGVEKNSELAFEWIMKAAKSGDPIAASAISEMYYTGEGVAQDEEKGLYWLKVSRGEI